MANPYFNAEYYLAQNPDVFASGINSAAGAWDHYINFGANEALNGAASRKPVSWFDISYYLAQNSDLAVAGITANQLLDHFVAFGMSEGRQPSAEANVNKASLSTYAVANPDLVQAFNIQNPADLTDAEVLALAQHFYTFGYAENRPGKPSGELNPGQTYALTTGVDTFTGTTGDDLFVAGETNGAKTLTAGDILKGGAGLDTIRVFTDNAAAVSYAGFEASEIEVLDATSDGGGQAFDLSGTSGLTTLRSTNSSAAVAFNQVTSLANVEVTSLTGANNVSVQYQNAVVAGAADAVSLTVNNSQAGAIQLGSIATGNGGVETVNLSAIGQASTIGTLNTNLTTLNFSGDQNVTITNVLNNTVRTIDASEAKGGLSVSTNTGKALSFTGGSGDDQVTFAAGTLTVADTVKGGAGNDRLVANQADLIASSSRVSEVEYIRVQNILTGTQGADTPATNLNAAKYADATRFELAQGYDNARIDNLNAAQQRVDILADRAGGNLGFLQIDDGATSSTDDQFTIALGTSGETVATVRNVSANVQFVSGEIETVNLISNGNAGAAFGAQNAIALSGGVGNVSSLNISGVEDIAVFTGASRINKVEAAEATGDVNLMGVQYSTTSGVTINTGSGDDRVRGTAKADTVSLGAGNDTYIATAGADTITLGEGNDTVVYGSNVSNTGNTDTITDFVSTVDRIDVSGLGVTSFTGNFANFTLTQGALAGGGVVSAVFQQDEQLLWVDVDGNGTLDNNDLRVKLSEVASIVAADLNLANAPIAVVAGQAVGDANAVVSQQFTAANAAALNGATINGGSVAPDTLTITNLNAAVTLGNGTTGGTLNNVENVVVSAVTPLGALTLAGALTGVNVNARAGLTADLGAGANNTFNGVNGAADTLTLGNKTQTATLDNGDNVLAAVAGATVTSGAGNTTINVTGLTGLAANFTDTNGAADQIVLTKGLTSAGVTTGTLNGFETLDLGQVAAGGLAVTLGATNGLTTLLGDGTTGAIGVTMTAAQLDALTTINNANATKDFTVTVSNGGVVNLADATLTNVAGITFTENSDVTVSTNQALTGSGAADILRITADLGAANSAAAGFETVIVTANQAGLTLNNDAITIQASAGGTFILGTGGDNFTGSGVTGYVVTDSTGVDTITFTSTGASQIIASTAAANGADTYNLNAGQVTVEYGHAVNNGGANADAIANFTAGAGGDVLRFDDNAALDLAGADTMSFIKGTAAVAGAQMLDANDVNVAVITGVSYANYAAVEGALNAAGGTETGGQIIVFHNATTNRVEVVFDSDGVGNLGNGTLLASMADINLVGVDSLANLNFAVV